jgi:hypothetical protein
MGMLMSHTARSLRPLTVLLWAAARPGLRQPVPCGADWVSARAIKTSDGTILIEALDNEAEAATAIKAGMRKVGLDPARPHTLGTLTPVFDVMSGGQTHLAMLWGGTAFNFSEKGSAAVQSREL